MNFLTHNETNVSVNGTCLQGVIGADYSILCELFGEPTEGDNYKTDAEWLVEFADGTVATIYNWKNGKNYCGEDGLDVDDICEWHVGGNSSRAVLLVEQVMEQ